MSHEGCMDTLEARFNNFILSRSSNESIDLLPDELFPFKKADYLVYSRSLTLEVKSLESDRGKVLNQKLSEMANSDPSFPKFFGTVSIESIIKAHKDSQKFRNWCMDFAGRVIKSNIKNANVQLQQTKDALDIPRSTGVLVILNDSIPLYDDDFIFSIVSKELNKKEVNSDYKRKCVEIVWFINELKLSESTASALVIKGPSLKNENSLTALDMLMTSWSSFNNYAIQIKET
jgi:hypothetical protein